MGESKAPGRGDLSSRARPAAARHDAKGVPVNTSDRAVNTSERAFTPLSVFVRGRFGGLRMARSVASSDDGKGVGGRRPLRRRRALGASMPASALPLRAWTEG